MKSICFESLKRENQRFQKPPKPKALDPSWYTDNIYSNHSIDLDEDYIPDCLKYPTNYRRLRDISEHDEYMNGRSDGGIIGNRRYTDGATFLQRSKSCKDFKYPPTKSRSCCFGGYDPALIQQHQSLLKSTVPKSYSFSGSRGKTKQIDLLDYELPTYPISRREKKSVRKAGMDFYCTEPKMVCCAREHCTNSKCLLEEICNYNNRKINREQRERRPHSNGANRRNIIAEWEERNRRPPLRYSNSCDEHCYRRPIGSKRRACYNSDYVLDQNLDSFEDEYCPADGGHYHRRSTGYYDNDLDNFIENERSRLMNQDKFLDDDEVFLQTNYHPIRNKSMLEVQPPSKYDDDTGSESTEMELEDFNFDIERYWEELDKPPSPIDLDMQQRNMNTNLKAKHVNVGCYNNGMPINDHDREQERLLIKKSLLEGMPSPPQSAHHPNNSSSGEFINFFDHSEGSPTYNQHHHHHHLHQQNHHHSPYSGRKIYPETTPMYKYNNFYPHDNLRNSANNHNSSSSNHNALSLINNIFSIYKPNKYSPLNCQLNKTGIITTSKKMNVPSTIRPLGAPRSEYMNSMKRPLIVSTEQPHFKIIPEKTGLKISPLFDYGDKKNKLKLKSTNRPLIFPH